MSIRHLYGRDQVRVMGKIGFLSNLAFGDIGDTSSSSREKHDLLDL